LTVMTYDAVAMPRNDTPFGDWIYRFRMHLNMTQASLAAMLNVSQNTVQRWEYGTRNPSGSAWRLLTVLARQADFEQPPPVQTGTGPRRREE
jgi:DNA-binding transcriptional regulator YiaG